MEQECRRGGAGSCGWAERPWVGGAALVSPQVRLCLALASPLHLQKAESAEASLREVGAAVLVSRLPRRGEACSRPAPSPRTQAPRPAAPPRSQRSAWGRSCQVPPEPRCWLGVCVNGFPGDACGLSRTGGPENAAEKTRTAARGRSARLWCRRGRARFHPVVRDSLSGSLRVSPTHSTWAFLCPAFVWLYILYTFSPHPQMCVLILERERGRETSASM